MPFVSLIKLTVPKLSAFILQRFEMLAFQYQIKKNEKNKI